MADVPIWMPEDLSEVLGTVFSFDISGCSELEGDKLFCGFQSFGTYVKDNSICELSFNPTDELGLDAPILHAFMPIEAADTVISFIEDQISERSQIETNNHIDMRSVLAPHTQRGMDHVRDDVCGWFDLDGSTFIFNDFNTFHGFRRLFGRSLLDIPHIDRYMGYVPPVGALPDDVTPLMLRLANIWGSAVSCDWNGKELSIKPNSPMAAI